MLNTTITTISALYMRLTSYSHWLPSQVSLGTVSSLLVVLYTSYAYLFSGNNTNKIPELGGLSIVNAWSFFNRRYDFLRSNFDKTGHELFSFKFLQYKIVAMSGKEARDTFFHEKALSLTEGHQFLTGGNPRLDDAVEHEHSLMAAFNKRLHIILHRDRLQYVLPTLFNDINRRMETWGAEGQMNPFQDIYDLVFQMTVRMTSCDELAADPKSVQKMSDLFCKLEKSATPMSLLFPWFPGTAKRNEKQAVKDLYAMLSHYVDVRRKAEAPNSDAIDIFITIGEDNPTIIGSVLNVIFAGVINTGMISCWTLLYLGTNNEWKDKATVEVRNLIVTYTDTTSSEPISQRLSTIPISAWEDEMPFVESIIRETMRIVNNLTLLRRSVTDNVQVGGKAIDKGAFLVYNMADVHLNKMFYSDPLTFDPDRFSVREREDKQESMPFLGWGTGRHPCTGMKAAKLEIKIIVALFLSRYEYKLVNASGNPLKRAPKPNRNDIHQSRPTGEPCFFQYKKLVE